MSPDKGLFLLRALEIPLRRKWIRFRTIASKKEICGQVAQLVTHSGNCENEVRAQTDSFASSLRCGLSCEIPTLWVCRCTSLQHCRQ